ncbi:hypothetical protein Mpet_2309 [Methanolacinia petrolearia DSM 11571]|uniref:Uncharacterized protein n=1 Tax=Methanolacinia petrolearia (strain DSM 11571 / OCM 486 / SEBR 4847) TaxID=679926 RepID=E1RD73_METP4|nr:hypothetical protein [Methanolacinia petrolearia]ADN37056.1 hypothetical protein Mpet_2309 [Methanolacinia petrolearia DSM 11571]
MLDQVKALKGLGGLSEAVQKFADEIDMDKARSAYENGGFKGQIILEDTEIIFMVRKKAEAEPINE